MIKKIIVPSILILYALIILLPPIVYHYTYPNGGIDTINHLQVFDQMKQGQPPARLYWGRYIVGYPIIWLSNITGISIDTIFLWFNFSILIGIGITVYLVINKFAGWWAGLLAVPAVVFSQSMLNMFNDGTIFELIILGIALPIFLYIMWKAVTTQKLYWLYFALGAIIFVLVFHLASAINMALSIDNTIPRIVILKIFYSTMIGLPILAYVFYLSCVVLGLRKQIDKKDGLIISVGVILILLILLAVVAFGFGKYQPIRIVYDMAIIVGILVALLIGLVMKYSNSQSTKVIVAVVIVLISIPCIVQYVGYNSAITLADKQAIEYVKQLDSDNFSCSSEINPTIYSRYIGIPYAETSDVYIQRNDPMTYNTTPNTPYYLGDKPLPSGELVIDYHYKDVTVSIYRK